MRQREEQLIQGWLALKVALLLSTLPAAAYAQEAIHRRQEALESITIMVWVFLWLFSTAGWAIVHLDTMVEWFGPADQLVWAERVALWRARLKIVQNYIASVGAGVAFYLMARVAPTWIGLNFDVPEMIIFVGVVPAAMGGTKTWDKFQEKFFSKAGPKP